MSLRMYSGKCDIRIRNPKNNKGNADKIRM